MSYNRISKPRFYCNVLEYLNTINYLEIDDVFRTLPVFSNTEFLTASFTNLPKNLIESTGFVALLGHQLASDNITYIARSLSEESTLTPILNGSSNTAPQDPDYNGFSICRCPVYGAETTAFTLELSAPSNIGSAVIGYYYDMDAPNLSLTLNQEFNTKEMQTFNGSTISNTLSDRPPDWGEFPAWELWGAESCEDMFADCQGWLNFFGEEECGETYLFAGTGLTFAEVCCATCNTRNDNYTELKTRKYGKRSWSLKFSYMGGKSLFGDNSSLGLYEETTYEEDLLTEDSFFKFWSVTLGGSIPFIFSPDNSIQYEPDNFAICRIRSNSLKATQVAYNMYDISMVIEELV